MIALTKLMGRRMRDFLLYCSRAGRVSLLATGHVILYVGHRHCHCLRNSILSWLAITLPVLFLLARHLRTESSTMMTLASLDELTCDFLLNIY